uniref:Haloalkane dehalogenase n=1 Tax=Pithovirus LCPAC101 TaxID=2506586 RepID=A0A481Z557_9VIRU|nr:MAG: haloalkane dehalogenase [Pithovirus LCPAC101]
MKKLLIDDFLFDTFNSKRIRTKPRFLDISLYGDYVADELKFWSIDYSDIGINKSFVGEDGGIHDRLKIAYSVFEPKNITKIIPTIILFHGVPVNRREWYDVAILLSRFMRVITVDLLGMGDSSKPLDFEDDDGYSYWKWRVHATIYKNMINDFKVTNPGWFINGKIFMGANDWGTGMVQKYVEMFGEEDLHGALIASAISLDGYWVQHIGSLKALKDLPYPSDTFTVESVRFQGVLTSLLETMFHNTPDIQNQYSMALMQDPYVEISYSDVNKNPDNTIYKSHAVRVLAQQASYALGNGELLPHHSTKNSNGIYFTKFNIPILMIWGKNDKMMPEGQVQKFSNIFHVVNYARYINNIPSNLTFSKQIIKDAGHFAASDQPEIFADSVIHWVRDIIGSEYLNTAYVGMTEIARQDEDHVISSLNKLYEKK